MAFNAQIRARTTRSSQTAAEFFVQVVDRAPSWLDAVGSPDAGAGGPAPLPALAQLDSTAEVEKLERSWQRLDRELRALDALIPPEPEPIPNRFEPAPPLPQSLWSPMRLPLVPWLQMQQQRPSLALPDAEQLQAGAIQSLSLDQALAIAFSNNPELQAQRERVAAALAELQAAMGTYWPRISAYAEGSTGQNSNNMNVPTGNDSLNGIP